MRLSLRAEQQDLEQKSQSLQADRDALEERKRHLTEMGDDLQARERALADQEGVLARMQAELAARQESIGQETAALAALKQEAAEIDRRQQDLAAAEESLHSKEAETAALQAALIDKQRCLEDTEADLRRRAQTLPVAGSSSPSSQNQHLAEMSKQLDQRDAEARATAEQIVSLQKRIGGVQAELTVMRDQKQKLTSERDGLHGQCDTLQQRCQSLEAQIEQMAEHLEAGRQGESDSAATRGALSERTTAGSDGAEPADPLAAIAVHAAGTRRRARTTHQPIPRQKVWMAVAVACVVGALVAGAVLTLRPARFAVMAQLVVPVDCPLAQSTQLTKAKRELGGRLLEAGLAGVASALLSAQDSPVAADLDGRALLVRVLSSRPKQASEDLRTVLEKYRKDLRGDMLTAARTEQAAELAQQIAGYESQLQRLAARKADLVTQTKSLGPRGTAYAAAAAQADKARKDLDELRSRGEKISAALRVLMRTPPASKAEVTPEQLAMEEARDNQLVAVRGQVAVRGGQLRTMLSDLVKKASAKVGEMDSHLATFLSFLDAQAAQFPTRHWPTRSNRLPSLSYACVRSSAIRGSRSMCSVPRSPRWTTRAGPSTWLICRPDRRRPWSS